MDPNSSLLSGPAQHPTEPCMEGGRSLSPREQSRCSPFAWSQVPGSSLSDPDCFGDEHIQAKRARVETIVRGMFLSPAPLGPGRAHAGDGLSCPEKAWGRKRKQSLPAQQGPLEPGPAGNRGGGRKGGPRVRGQLHLLRQQVRHLRERVLRAVEPRAAAQGPATADQRHGPGPGPWGVDSDHHHCPGSVGDLSRLETHRVSEVQYLPEGPRFLPSEARALLESLKKELTGAISQAVDSVLQKVLVDPSGRLTQLGGRLQGPVPDGRSEPSPPEGGAHKDPLPLAALPRRAQPPAGAPLGSLSLAKSLDPPRYPISPRMIPKPYQAPPADCPFVVAPAHIQEEQILGQLLGHGPGGRWRGGLPQDPSARSQPSSEVALRPWGAARLRPLASGQQQCPWPFTSTCLERLALVPPVKMEPGGLQAITDTLPFSAAHIQEGLNPGHLKKAKLMFFFTRYPSSNLLKAYFPDVQFNRCITSQMIKWFSNFREFYYIQMEKFARQAISDGVTNPKMLVVLRDSELFRALNMHYNKGNDFEVPDCFLEIASLTLQEFFRAVSTGKDADPSWKKPIYKIISKLDSDIPEIFKSSSYPQELFRN
ncbi:prospero homeobox protein 2 isoform X1 [Cervus canadensis]|uniref:prospero homeobox protein 2 isoform X1 n=1 Tax=Cervus canadensis TaxID=1574408 RepID=UPI001C9E337E|nr:prospero homeobox protein 2 isoform X1 [Cervus canadensis]